MLKNIVFLIFLIFVNVVNVYCQAFKVSGAIKSEENNEALPFVKVFLKDTKYITSSDLKGHYLIKDVPVGEYELVFFMEGKTTVKRIIQVVDKNLKEDIALKDINVDLEGVTVIGQSYGGTGITRLRSVEGTAIYASKKTEVVVLKDVKGNLAANTARQVFGKVVGLNIWESDGAGIQLGIGSRGLNPSRSTDFNMRQNGYDISADVIGYNESYYTPPALALERIEVVKGAASLQYGPHFGGMINFVFKKAPQNKKIEVESIQTGGSFGFFNSYNAVGGTVGKLNYYGFYQYKRGDGWRANSNFDVHTAYAHVGYNFTPNLSVSAEYTHMQYLARQAGGLTTAQFESNPRKSYRNRNWFKLNWNLVNLSLDYVLSDRTKINMRNFSLFGSRQSLGFLGPINRPDNIDNPEGEYAYRMLLWDDYLNFGSETRLIHHYSILNRPATFLTGFRIYKGMTYRKQGNANDSNKPDFYYLDKKNVDSDFTFPGTNSSYFVENIFNISPKFTVTPGLRVEFIRTVSNGYYLNKDVKTQEQKSSSRAFPLFGLGMSYKPNSRTEFYGNISQNYKAINFNDLRVTNPNKKIDLNLKDESGYNIDLGARGNISKFLNYDASIFFLYYNDRISTITITEDDGTIINNYSLITNAGNSLSSGLESFLESDILAVLRGDTARTKLFVYSNLTLMKATYRTGKFKGNYLEYSPTTIFRGGITLRRKHFWTNFQYSFTSEHYSDGSNTKSISTEVTGLIPSYYVIDVSAGYSFKQFNLTAGINNLTNNMYFTRRALSYPGPGIIPSDGRNFYITLGAKF